MKNVRKRTLKLHRGEEETGKLTVTPGAQGYTDGTYLWVGTDIQCFGYTRARKAQLRAFAHTILRAIGDE